MVIWTFWVSKKHRSFSSLLAIPGDSAGKLQRCLLNSSNVERESFQDGLTFPYGCWWNFLSIPADESARVSFQFNWKNVPVLFNATVLNELISTWEDDFVGKTLPEKLTWLAGISIGWSCISYQKCWLFQPAMLVFWSVTYSKHLQSCQAKFYFGNSYALARWFCSP